jgi:cellulose synthase/poly-beta-1,6-N-acetylglucosamine synthase-like glycosyltransferase/peptidoglycan/xylan/chitin deacetylase (PgdA/CDA1 family)
MMLYDTHLRPSVTAEPIHVFEDLTGRRQILIPVIGYLLLLALAIFIADFILRVEKLAPASNQFPASSSFEEMKLPGHNGPTGSHISFLSGGIEGCAVEPRSATTTRRSVAAFVPAGDPTSTSALAAHCGALDLVLAQSFAFGAPDGSVQLLDQQAFSLPIAGAGAPGVFAVIGPNPATSQATLHAVLDTDALLTRMVADLSRLMDAQQAHGLCLDLSGVQDLTPGTVLKAVRALEARALQAGQQLCLIGIADAAFWGDSRIVDAIDLAVLRAFAEPETPTSLPSSLRWFRAAMADVGDRIPAEKRVIALGGFGFAWQSGRLEPERLSYAEVMYRMSAGQGSLGFSPEVGSAKIRHLDARRRVNDIWLLDAVTFHNQISQLDPGERIAVWPLGYEDPAIWALLERGEAPWQAAAVLDAPIDLGQQLRIEGTGPIAAEVIAAVPGQRTVTQDAATGLITAQAYATIPVPGRIMRGGMGPAGALSLSFEGLPTAAHLPPLLEILAHHNVDATFFVDGRTMLARGEGASLIEAAGHTIGMIVTRAEPTLPSFALGAGLIDNGTQLLIAHETGRRTLFVRERLADDPLPESLDDLAVLVQQRSAGYLPLFAGIAAPFGPFAPQSFVDRVRGEALADGTDVLTFDLNAGNDREVIAVLPAILAGLQDEGFEFGPLRGAAGLSTAQAMPSAAMPAFLRDALAFLVIGFFLVQLTTVFLWLMLIAAARSLIYLGLALLRGTRTAFDPDFQPPVTVIVPAYNEEKVIEKCLDSILQSDYANFTVVVVDDGSTDRTSQIVAQKFGQDERVMLLQEENRGKWHAANFGLSVVETPYFVIADADSLFFPDTVRWLVQQFKDDRVGAVAGLVEVGNHENLLTACQRVEYIVSQSVMRRAYETFEGILVVPGAVGAWRTEAVLRAQAFSGETITEDADLTVAVHRAGYRVRFQEQARSVTEAPATVRAFMRQRLRWTFGMLEVSWKHRGAIAEGRAVGLSIIDAIWFGLVSCLLSPLVDVLLLLLLVDAIFLVATGGELSWSGFPTVVLLSYFFLTAIDMMNTIAAFWFERRFQWRLLVLVPFLRFGYRQLLYISTIRAIWHALTGHMAGWNKLERTGSVAAMTILERTLDRPSRPLTGQLGPAE